MGTPITALKIEPGGYPCVVDLYTHGHSLEYAVSIGARYLCTPSLAGIDDNVGVLFNGEAALIGLRGNRRIGGRIFAGVIYLVGLDESGNIVSLSHRAIDKYWTLLYEPVQISDDEVTEDYFDRIFAWLDDL